jgi:hypothetical protein
MPDGRSELDRDFALVGNVKNNDPSLIEPIVLP